jgi:ATP-binding cassette, subfamily B, bacterial
LFSGTVAENIAYGLDTDRELAGLNEQQKAAKLAEIREKVVAAAKLANAHDFISEFPMVNPTLIELF